MITVINKKVLRNILKGKGRLRRIMWLVLEFLNLVNFNSINKMKKYISNIVGIVVVAELTQLG